MLKDKILAKVPPIFQNKYVLVSLAVLVWMTFFDENNFISQWKRHSRLKMLEEQETYYNASIKKAEEELKELTFNPVTQEKFAREKYHMKRANEDVFIIVPPQPK